MSDDIKERLNNIRIQINRNNEMITKINFMRQKVEDSHLRRIKRLKEYMDCDSLSEADRLEYSDKCSEENKRFLSLNDDYDEAIKKINRDNEEKEEEARKLKKQLKKDEEKKEDNNSSENSD